MASQKAKRELQEDLNNALIDENASNYAVEYEEHLESLQLRAVKMVEDGKRPTQKALRKGVRIVGTPRNVRSAFILGNINQLIQDDRNTALKRELRPLVNFMNLYNAKNVDHFIGKLTKLVDVYSGIRLPLNNREVKAFGEIRQFLNQNRESVQQLIKTQQKAIKRINKEITTNQSRQIIKARNRLIKERITVDGVTRPLTNEEIGERLREQFSDNKGRLERILQTEIHSQNELVREVTAKGLGYKFKVWNTQRDSRVRQGHKEVDRIVKKIDQKFRVFRYKTKNGVEIRAGSDLMEFPGDKTAHPSNTINCRCFLTYIN